MKLATIALAFSIIAASAAEPKTTAAPKGHVSAWTGVKELVVVMQSASGSSCKGSVRFTQVGEKIKVTAEIEGLTPGQKHAIHVHEFGDVTAPDGMGTGGHYNPEGHQHGLTSQNNRHAGDLGNLQADDKGKAHYEVIVENISLVGLKNPIIGRAVIIHAKADDGGQPVGNAGARIAQGVIGLAKPPAPAPKPVSK